MRSGRFSRTGFLHGAAGREEKRTQLRETAAALRTSLAGEPLSTTGQNRTVVLEAGNGRLLAARVSLTMIIVMADVHAHGQWRIDGRPADAAATADRFPLDRERRSARIRVVGLSVLFDSVREEANLCDQLRLCVGANLRRSDNTHRHSSRG